MLERRLAGINVRPRSHVQASPQLTEALITLGPWVVLLMTFAETAFITGFFVPALPTIMLACLLALEGHFGLGGVVLATVSGGALGDSTGFWVGRRGGRRLLEGGGRIRELARRGERRTTAIMDRHSLLGVSLARCVSFVRTLMPLTAGMSNLGYRRFLLYDMLGVAVWAAGSILVGVGAAAGWRRVRDDLGPWWAAGAVLVVAVVWSILKIRRMMSSRRGGWDEAGPGAEV